MPPKLLTIFALLLLACISSIYSVGAATVADAEKLKNQGRYREAVSILNQKLDENDRDIEARKVRQFCCIKIWKPDLALSDLLFLAGREPGNHEWRFQMAQVFLILDQEDRILASLEAASKIAPKNTLVSESKTAWTAQAKKDYLKAGKIWSKCIAANPQNDFARLSRACLFEKTGKWQDAIKDLAMLKRDREDVRPYAFLIKWYCSRAQISEALTVASELEKVNSTSGITARASIFTQADQQKEAIEEWTKVIEKEPREPNWRVNRASVYLAANQTTAALNDLNYAVNLTLRNKERHAEMLKHLADAYVEMEEYEKAIAFLTQAITAHSANQYALLVARARCQLAVGRKDEALRDLKSAMSTSPQRSEAPVTMGLIYAKEKRWDLAEPYFMKGINTGFSDKELFKSMFELYLKKPDIDKAMIVLQKWKQSIPNDPESYMSAARMYRDRAKFEEAASEHEQALARGASPLTVYTYQAKIHKRLERFDDAITDYSKIIAIQGDQRSADYYVGRAECYVKKNDLKRALADYDKALSWGPKYTGNYGRAGVLLKLGKYDQALADIDAAIRLKSKASEAQLLRGKILVAKKDYAQARKQYTSLILRFPTLPSLYRERARVLQSLGETEKAKKDITTAEQLERR